MKKINLNLLNVNLRDSPLSILFISVIFISLGYLVSLHPDGFQMFFRFIMVTSFVVLTALLVKWYTPFNKLCDYFITNHSKTTPVKALETYHNDVKQNTQKALDKLFQSQQYKKYAELKQQNPNAPVVLCSPATFAEVQEDTKDLQAVEQQIFEQDSQII